MTIFPSFFVNKTGGYEIEQSLRFNEAFLSRTPSSAGNRRTFTFSVWLKRSGITAIGGFFSAFSNNTLRDAFRFDTSDEFRIFFNETTSGNIFSNAKHRDISAWYHFVVAVDTTQATAADRVKVWANGELVSFRSASYPAQNTDLNVNNNVGHYVGHAYSQTDQEWQGYLAEFHHVDGTALDHEDFGEFDDNGVWRPKRYTGTYGTNGFYLKFDPSATNGIGHDHSGNGNNFTASGFTTSGTGTDVMSDTPTTNWCTLNPLRVGYSSSAAKNVAFAEGNLRATFNTISGWQQVATSSINFSSGKWYAESYINTEGGTYPGFGIGQASTLPQGNGTGSLSVNAMDNSYHYSSTGQKVSDAGASSYGSTWTTGDTIGIAIDCDNNKIWWSKNGTWQASGDPSAGTNAAFTITSGIEYCLALNGWDGGSQTLNFGQRAFAYTPPTGFKALNTANLPAPDIANGSDYFNTVTYSGDNSSPRTISTVGFQSDFVWVKNRTDTGPYHMLTDAVRGGGKTLFSNDTLAEVTNSAAGYISGFATNGFELTAGGSGSANVNATGKNYVAWNWLAGNGTSSNTNGSITSTVSANPTAGFSIVSYTGNGVNGATWGHGLGVPPDLVIVKNRDAEVNWAVYHSGVDATAPEDYWLLLDDTNGRVSNSTMWSSTAPTSTTMKVGNLTQVNTNNQSYVAYCFAEVEGYSKFGSYTGNGSTDGPFVFCGFKPRWIMLKKTNTSTIYTSWSIYDTARDSYNVSDAPLYANVADQEGTNSQGTVESGHNVDILSNGFKLRDSNQIRNTSGDTYIFAAFAEHPTGGSGVSPATAR